MCAFWEAFGVDCSTEHRIVWIPVVTYAALIFISSTCFEYLRTWLWLPVEQRAVHTLSTAAHAHIMSLSCDFHDSKNTSDLVQALQGAKGMVNLLDIICFQVLPLLIDIIAAFVFLWSFAGPLMGVIMIVTSFSYLYLTSKMIAFRTKSRRRYVKYHRKEWTVGHSSMDGWTTASVSAQASPSFTGSDVGASYSTC